MTKDKDKKDLKDLNDKGKDNDKGQTTWPYECPVQFPVGEYLFLAQCKDSASAICSSGFQPQ